MNTLALTFSAAAAPDASVGATGASCAFSFFYPDYAYFYFYSLAGDT